MPSRSGVEPPCRAIAALPHTDATTGGFDYTILTIMFNRKRVGDVQYLQLATYNLSNTCSANEQACMEALTPLEKILSRRFKRVVTEGKGSKPIPILFSNRMQKFIKCIIEIGTNSAVVPTSNPYLFANPESENRWMSGTNIMRKLAQNCGVERPSLLTSTRFRKHIATTLQLMNMEEYEMEQTATFMGHTKKTHLSILNFRLPQDIFQTAKVAKILLLLEKENNNVITSPFPQSDKNPWYDEEEINLNLDKERLDQKRKREQINKKSLINKLNVFQNLQSVRHRWTATEKRLVINYFKSHISKKLAPNKHECEQLIGKHKDIFGGVNWVLIKTLVYNSYRQK
ncbi:hypothetical protein MML48_2g00008999 [Holotrichia oblita]|uniref:Uncharacterized protein n=1 Tax=Holotrichia oblita TaxID=644536 RepID=A0ACB9TML6_HOLOL|nr:hypothetical protein MML48_2g00008999 [Holotrichia oblita]